MQRSAFRFLVVTLLLAGSTYVSAQAVSCPQSNQIQAADPAGPAPVPLPPSA